MTVTAADGVPQDSQVLQIAKAKAGKPEFGGVAAGANHDGTRIRPERREIQRGPTEELMPGFGFRCTVAKEEFVEE
jgi:hypothetical protein